MKKKLLIKGLFCTLLLIIVSLSSILGTSIALAAQSSSKSEYIKNSDKSFEIYDQAMSKYQIN